jgi:hypothetical protein
MSKQDDTSTEETTMQFDVMPGADRPDEDPAGLDLNFGLTDDPVTAEVAEEEVVEEEVA